MLSGQDALDMGVSGPILRASGVALDMRKANPYCGYDQYEFEVPTGQRRRLLRPLPGARGRDAREHQDLSPGARPTARGPVRTEDRKVMPPPREELAKSMEAVIHHFKLWTEGIKPPAGEA